jgi:iron complex transport system substrate-binding protein
MHHARIVHYLSRLLLTMVAFTIMAPLGCDDRAPSPSASPATQPGASNQPQRLVTLAPGLTQMVVDLGAGARLVGVAKNDDAAPAEVPIVGTYTQVNLEALLQADPTHVLMMTAKEGPPERLQAMAEAGRFELVAYPYPRTIEQVLGILHHDGSNAANGGADPPTLGSVIHRTRRAAKLKHDIQHTLQRLKTVTAPWPEPNVLLVINTNPLRVTGPGAVNDQLLRYVGARNAAADANVPAVSLNRESLLQKQPEVIVLLDPASPPLRENDQRLALFNGLAIPAVQNQRIALLNDPLILLPSTNLADTAIALAKAIHPDRAAAIDQARARDP